MLLTQLDDNTTSMECTILQCHCNSLTAVDTEEVYGREEGIKPQRCESQFCNEHFYSSVGVGSVNIFQCPVHIAAEITRKSETVCCSETEHVTSKSTP